MSAPEMLPPDLSIEEKEEVKNSDLK